MVAIGRHINLAFCKHTWSVVRSRGADRSPRTDVAHWFVGKSNMPSDFLVADLHVLTVLSKGVNLRGQSNVSKQTHKCTHEMRDAAGQGHQDSRGLPLFCGWFLFCIGVCFVFLSSWSFGKSWSKCIVLDCKRRLLCDFFAISSDSWNVIGFISATNPLSTCQTSSQSGQALKFTTSDSCDRIKDEFQFLQAQYHRCRRHTHTHTPFTRRVYKVLSTLGKLYISPKLIVSTTLTWCNRGNAAS